MRRAPAFEPARAEECQPRLHRSSAPMTVRHLNPVQRREEFDGWTDLRTEGRSHCGLGLFSRACGGAIPERRCETHLSARTRDALASHVRTSRDVRREPARSTYAERTA